MTDYHHLPRQGKRIRILIGEAQEWHGKPLYRAIVELAARHGAAGATVTRGIEGFGPENHLSTDRLPDLSENLPVMIDIIDSNEQVESLLPLIDQVVQQGIIIVTPVEILSLVGGSMTFSSLALTGAVGVAGALGALARYLLGRFIAERADSIFPWGTFAINLSGAFLIGLLFALAGHKLLATELQVILATGFLGGYTTFSTMSWEGLQLARGGSTRQSILYLGSSAALGLLAAALGLGLGWLL